MALAIRTSLGLKTPRAFPLRVTSARRAVAARAEPDGPSPVLATGQDWVKAQAGISAPFGFFDPLNLTGNPAFTVDSAKRFREAELAHSRVAMLAAIGWIVAEEFHPLFGGDIGGPAFVHFQKVVIVWPQFPRIIFFVIAVAEGYRLGLTYNDPRDAEKLRRGHVPGDLGFDPLGLYPTDPATQFEIRTKELNNGRLAMIGIAGMAVQEEIDHTTVWRGFTEAVVDLKPPPPFPPYEV